VPAPRTPVPVENLPPSVRPGGIYKPAPPPQPAAPKPSPGPAPPDETVDLGIAPALATAAPAADASAAPAAVTARAAAPPSAPTPAAAGAPSADGPLQLAWQGPYRVKVGQEFRVALEVNASADLRRLPLVVNFDPVVLTFLDAQLAEFASKSGVSAASPEVDTQRGRIVFDLQAAPGRSFRGQGVLLSLRFAARSPRQQTQLTLSNIDLKDDSGAIAAAVRPTPLTLRVGS
jgi:hypothetical protein